MRKFYKTGKHVIYKDGKYYTSNFKPSNFRKKIIEENLIYDRKLKAWVSDEQDFYRSTITFLYSETRGQKRKEEIRIEIVSDRKITENDINNIFNKYVEKIGFELPAERIKGTEINERIDEHEARTRLNKFVCHLLMNNSELLGYKEEIDLE